MSVRAFVFGVAWVSLFASMLFASMAARAHSPDCTVVPLANVDAALLRAAVGDREPPLVANECMHGSAHMWRFFWGVDEVDGYWRAYGYAHCYTDYVLSCSSGVHVTTGDDDLFIAIPHGVSLARLRELVGAIGSIEPTAQVRSVAFTAVGDGTRWSEERFGYEVTYAEPSDWGGSVVTLVRQCDAAGCRWAQWFEPDFSGVEIGQKEGCRNVPSTEEAYRKVERLARNLIEAAPARIVECVDDVERVRVVRYATLERFEDWKKGVEVRCLVEAADHELERCEAIGQATRSDGEMFTLAPAIPLALAIELRVLVMSRVTGAHVASISHNAVTDGGAWSAQTQGYSVAATGGLKFAAGAYYDVVERCASGSCGLHFFETDVRRTWVY